MKLENVTAEIRPRGKWESVDLGVALVQRNFKAVMVAWSCTVLPLMLMILAASYAWYSYQPFHFNSSDDGFVSWMFINLPLFVVWWLKPIYERVPLYILSRSLFGEKISISELIKQWPKMMTKGLFTLLIKRRIGSDRSFVMPVSELEGLKGKQYKQRVGLLSRNGGEGASGLTIAASFLELVGILTFFLLYVMFAGYNISSDYINGQMELLMNSLFCETFSDRSVFSMMILLLCYQVVITVLTPFYVGGGFALYINSRTISEGWDIELAFKRMSERLAKLKEGMNHTLFTWITVLGIGFLLMGTEAQAVDLVADGEAIQTIVNADEFDLVVREIPVNETTENNSAPVDLSLGWIAEIGTVLLYLIIAAAVVLIGYAIYKNLYLLKGEKAVVTKKIPVVKSVLGMDVTPESLPSDILQSAQDAWRNGDTQLALSLFYRGSLVWLVNTAELPILESDTEQDCLAHAKSISRQDAVLYFERLTKLWTAKAYGKIEPDVSAIEWLCSEWPFSRLTEKGGVK